MTIKPGIYPDMSFDEYLAADALSMSAIATLIDSFPARLLHQKPPTRPMAIGRIMHAVQLEARDFAELGCVVVPSGFSAAHTKKNAAERPEIVAALDAGMQPLREADAESIRGMHAALRADERAQQAFSNGRPEVSVFWSDERTGLLCKARFDWLPDKGAILPDLKTCESLDDAKLSRAVVTYKIAHRSYWYEQAARSIGVVDPIYAPVWIEKTPPHFCAIRPVSRFYVDAVRFEVEKAVARYAHCRDFGIWPGPSHFDEIEPPAWETKRLEYEYGADPAIRAQEPMEDAA